jgi:hypothetical protein
VTFIVSNTQHEPRDRACEHLAAFTALAAIFLAGCGPWPKGGGQLATPTFSVLEIPDPSGSNNWTTFSTSSPPTEVLPTRGRAVRVWFYAPVGSIFGVSLRALDGTVTMLAEKHGTPAPPEAGLFEMVGENVSLNPPLYTMYVRAPQALMDPANYDILLVAKSLRTNVADSNPMVVALRQRKVFRITVQVSGSGHVVSNPAGIRCGTAPSGAALTDCSYEFGPGTINLAPAANDLNTTKFIAWAGNCAASVQVCVLTLTGMAPVLATATFGARTTGGPASTCPAAPLLPGFRWIGLPDCATGSIDAHPGISHPAVCDSDGYFCCEPGGANSNAPRCGGEGAIESTADCRTFGIKGMLRQPGGCYEVASFP